MRESWVENQSARLLVSEVGAGAPVTFLHAGVADRRSWYDVMGIVGQSHTAIAYDRRGYGSTTYTSQNYSHTGDLLAVLDERGIDRTVLVGCSNGGQIAFATALHHPDRVTALVLIGSAPPGAPPTPAGPAADALFASIEEAEFSGDVALVNELEAHLWLDGPGSVRGRVDGPARDLFLDMNGQALRANSPGDADPLAATWQQLPELSLPALIIVGALDLPPIVEQANQMAQLIPDAEIHLMDEAAHLPMLEQPTTVAARIMNFTQNRAT